MDPQTGKLLKRNVDIKKDFFFFFFSLWYYKENNSEFKGRSQLLRMEKLKYNEIIIQLLEDGEIKI